MKTEYFRSRKLLNLARGMACMCCGREDGTIVAAHSNQSRHGRGMHLKSHDCFIAWLCYRCHTMLDAGDIMNREEKIDMWSRAHDATILYMFQHRMIGPL